MPPSEGAVPGLTARRATDSDDRLAEVHAALAQVTDPELDQSVVELDFLARVAIDGDRVAVDFRLPTFWCSAGFAWIMAEDMRRALMRLPWVKGADIRLVDHFAAARINAGVASGAGFGQAFAGEVAGDLAALRQTFRQKAFLGRMSRLIEALRAGGMADTAILALTVGDLDHLTEGDRPEVAALARRYRELRGDFGGPATSLAPAFAKPDGEPIPPAGLGPWLRDIRMTRRGVEANGEMCRILLAGRYGAAGGPSAEPLAGR